MRVIVNLIFLFSYLFAQGFPIPMIKYDPKSYICYKSNSPIIIDGKLNDESWSKTEWSDSFVDIEGPLKPNPFYNTKVKMLWDENYFYFGALLEEEHLWATLTARDAVIYYDNDFEIFLDPDGDTHHYYELEVNAYETEWDLLLIKPYRDQSKVAIDSWDIPGLLTKVHLEGSLNDPTDLDQYWSVEIAIPWKALEECAPNVHPLDGEQWKVNFSRVHWNLDITDSGYVKKDTPEYNWVWSPQGLINMHYPEMWGLVQFSENFVGENTVAMKASKLDKNKWALRQVYYRQQSYFNTHQRFTGSLKALKLLKPPVADTPWPPSLSLTPSGWEASMQWEDRSIFIRKDGKVWVE
tara:strand:- start:225 stop:1280 length:1056 start_codon:yes stop_codon:yes gene_type:complete